MIFAKGKRYQLGIGLVAKIARIRQVNCQFLIEGSIVSPAQYGGNVFFVHRWFIDGSSVLGDSSYDLKKELPE